MSMLRGSIQALEVQRGTIVTLKSMSASFAAAVNATGAIAELLTFAVPAGWFVKVTVVHAAITSTTYY